MLGKFLKWWHKYCIVLRKKRKKKKALFADNVLIFHSEFYAVDPGDHSRVLRVLKKNETQKKRLLCIAVTPLDHG